MSVEIRLRLERDGFRLDADLGLPATGVTALTGPSGCGKTTLLRAIAGLEPAARGTVRVNGTVWQDETTFLPPHRRRVGFVFQEASLFGHLDVKKNIEYGMKRRSRHGNGIRFDHLVSLLGTGHLLERRPHQLSGGQQRRVAIARALAAAPQLLLLDEPLSALDPAGKEEIMACLDAIFTELALPVIMVSHAPEEIERLATTRIEMTTEGYVTRGRFTEKGRRPAA